MVWACMPRLRGSCAGNGCWRGCCLRSVCVDGFAYAIALLAGLAVGYAFVPPSAGSVLVAGTLGVDLGTMIAVGVPTAFIAMALAGVWWGRSVGGRMFTPVPQHVFEAEGADGTAADRRVADAGTAAGGAAGDAGRCPADGAAANGVDGPDVTAAAATAASTGAEAAASARELPSFGMVMAIVLTPLLLILLGTVSAYLPLPGQVRSLLAFTGKPFVALTFATLVAMYVLGTRRGYSGTQFKALFDRSLKPVGMILLVIACGGVIRWMLQDCGLGEIIGPALERSQMPLVLVGFLIAAVVRARDPRQGDAVRRGRVRGELRQGPAREPHGARPHQHPVHRGHGRRDGRRPEPAHA